MLAAECLNIKKHRLPLPTQVYIKFPLIGMAFFASRQQGMPPLRRHQIENRIFRIGGIAGEIHACGQPLEQPPGKY